MAFEPKEWKDEEGPDGLVDAASLIDLEERVTSEAALPDSVVLDTGDETISAPAADKYALILKPAASPTVATLHVEGAIHAGNLANTDRGMTRGLNVIHGRSMLATDPEDLHGALIIGSAEGMAAEAPWQVFGAEIQAETLENVKGIAPGGVGLVGVNGLALYRSDETTPYLVGFWGAPQIEQGSEELEGTATWALGFMADTPVKSAKSTITNAAGMYIREQDKATNNYGLYLVSESANGGRITWANDTHVYRLQEKVLATDGGLTFGSGAVSNGTTAGIVTGLSKLCFTKDGNNAPRIFLAGTEGIYLAGGTDGVLLADAAGNLKVQANETGVGFFGHAPVARPNIKTPAEVTTQELGEALVSLGLIE